MKRFVGFLRMVMVLLLFDCSWTSLERFSGAASEGQEVVSDHDQPPLPHRNVIKHHSFIYLSVLNARETVIAVLGELTEQRVDGNIMFCGKSREKIRRKLVFMCMKRS